MARHAALVAALDATDGLDTAWTRLSTGSVAATSMSRLLAEHDRLIVAAADRGVNAKYASAIKVIDEAKAQIAAARALRDRLSATVDVTVLDEWLTRNEDYDVALQNLYSALSKVGNRVTKATRAAVKAEAEARAQLPPDTRGLVVIMAEIGQGGMSRAVIAIEEARAKLTDALEAGTAPRARTLGALTPLTWVARGYTVAPNQRSTERPSRRPSAAPSGGPHVQLRVVTDQPWDVPADVLVVPIAAKPAFDGPLGELDRRAGGELQTLVAFGEFSGKRYATALAPGGETASGRVLAVGLGDAATLDRETVGRVAAAAERRLGGRTVKRLAIWITPLADGLDGDASVVAGLVARGVVEGTYDPRTIYRDEVDSAPPILDELILIAPGADAAALTKAAERGIVIAEGANIARTLSNRASNDVSPAVLADEARAIAEQHGLWIDVIDADKATEMGMGMFMAVGRGSDNPPQDDRHALGRGRGARRARPPPRDRRQGRLLRLGRDQHQALGPDGRDEDGQDRCVHRDRGHRHGRPPGARHAAVGRRARGREHARAAFDAAGRHRHGAQRQEGRRHQHRRRGPAHPRRRADLRRAARGDPPRRHRDADRGGRRARSGIW